MKKWLTFVWIGFVAALKGRGDFKSSSLILLSIFLVVLPMTFLFYSTIDYSFFTAELGTTLKLLLSFFSASFIWMVVIVTVGMMVVGTVDFVSAVLQFKDVGEKRYYTVYDILKDTEDKIT